jgi:dihydrofolate reductase
VTYEAMARYWPTSTHAYAAPMNEIPKIVFSNTLDRGDWGDTRIVRGDLAEQITKLKREPGKDLSRKRVSGLTTVRSRICGGP